VALGPGGGERGFKRRTPLTFASEQKRTEVVRLLLERGADPAIADEDGCTPLMGAWGDGHRKVVRVLLGHPIARTTIDLRDTNGVTALWWACYKGCARVARALLENGADPTIVDNLEGTPLMAASSGGHPKVVRRLLGRPIVKMSIDRRDCWGRTALWWACLKGHGGAVRALLESGADPAIGDNNGTAPMAIAEQPPDADYIIAEGRRKCVAALKVRLFLRSTKASSCSQLSRRGYLPWAWWQEAERAYQLWKARQVADAASSFAAPVLGARTRGEIDRWHVEAVPEHLKHRVAEGGRGLPGVSVVAARKGRKGSKMRAALLEHAVQSLKPGVFEELMEMMG
jgi:ankyrin repeat protein